MSIDSFLHSLKISLDHRRNKGLYRELKNSFDPDSLIDLCSNDYLSLARNSDLSDQFSKIISEHGIPFGSSGSRLLTGNHPIHEDLEAELASFHRHEAALLFSSGYTANLGVLASLPTRHDSILFDKLCHASLRDGIRLSSARSFSFKHNSVEDLKAKLSHCRGNVFVVVESVYSVDGDLAPLEQLVAICQEKGLILIVDEAHATGVYGEQGRGLVAEYKLEEKIPIRVHTFGKALGFQGAVVVSSLTVKESLVNFSRSFIYSTAPSPLQVAAIKLAYSAVKNADKERGVLSQLIDTFCNSANDSRYQCSTNPSPLQSVMVRGNHECRKLANELNKSGFAIYPILSPTVPAGKERLRVCLHAHNSRAELEAFFKRLERGV